jgi:beta-mannanase
MKPCSDPSADLQDRNHQPQPLRRSIMLALGSAVATQLLSACGAAGSSSNNQEAAASSPTASAAVASKGSPAASATSATTTVTPTVTTTAGSASSAAAHTPSKLIVGAFSGGYDSASAEAYDKWLGINTAYNVDFLTGSNTSWDISQWAALKTLQPAHNMLFSIPCNDMSGTIAGDYDAIYQSMAASVAATYPSAIIRIAWEMNGGWYNWSAANRVSTYTQAYNHVAAIFRAKSASFMLEWCPNNGVSSNMDCLAAYPGDQYVDCIGMDTYLDYRYGTGTSASRWSYLVGNTRGLQWQVSFAGQHGKKLSIPEWGVNLDDPLFIENMHAWLVSNGYHHASYWDSNSNFQGQLSENQYPNAAAAFKSLFGA